MASVDFILFWEQVEPRTDSSTYFKAEGKYKPTCSASDEVPTDFIQASFTRREIPKSDKELVDELLDFSQTDNYIET